MDRQYYYNAIAFFGMINGLFNQVALLFTILHMQILAPALLFGSTGLTLMLSSLMVSTASIILGGIPAAIYERVAESGEESSELSMWNWTETSAILTLPSNTNVLEL